MLPDGFLLRGMNARKCIAPRSPMLMVPVITGDMRRGIITAVSYVGGYPDATYVPSDHPEYIHCRV